MKKLIKAAIALMALSISATVSAMPEQVPDKWYSNMMFRLDVMAGNHGFCRGHPQAWICGN